MYLLIAGSRGYTHYVDFKRKVDKMITKLDKKEITIIEGGARGVDRLGRRYAIENNIPYKTFVAEWDKYGKRAGMMRNALMAETATHAIIFWDGKSPGTKNMIALLKEREVKHVVIKVSIPDEHTSENHQSSEG